MSDDDRPTGDRGTTVCRRGILAACVAGVAGTTGCMSDFPGGTSRSAHDLFLHNETDAERRVSVTVTDVEDGTTNIDDTVTIESGADHNYNNDVYGGQDVEVEVSLDDGRTASADWTDVSSLFSVRIRDDEIAMSERAQDPRGDRSSRDLSGGDGGV
jgi:hypothetical protein